MTNEEREVFVAVITGQLPGIVIAVPSELDPTIKGGGPHALAHQ